MKEKMKKNKYIFLLFFFLVSCSKVDLKKENENLLKDIEEKKINTEKYLEQKNRKLSLDDCIDIVLKNNLKIKLKELEEKISGIDKKIAFSNFLPKISSIYSFNEMEDYLTTSLTNPEISFNILGGIKLPSIPTTINTRMVDKSFKNYALTAQMPIFVPATWFLYSAREKGEEISRYNKNLTEKMLKLKVISEFYYILALEDEQNLLKKEKEHAEKFANNAKVAFETGSILEWQYKQAELFLKKKINALNNNEKDLKIAKITLLNDLNLNLEDDFNLIRPDDKKDRSLISLEDAVYNSLVNNDMIKISHNLHSINKDKVKIAISNFLPQVILGGGLYGTSLNIISPQNILLGSLTGIFSIFEGFKNINEYEKAKLEEKASYIKREEIAMNTILSTITVYTNLQKSLEEKELANENYEISKEKFRQKTLEKEVGYIDESDYMKEISELENSFIISQKASYKYNVLYETLNILIGKDDDRSKDEKK